MWWLLEIKTIEAIIVAMKIDERSESIPPVNPYCSVLMGIMLPYIRTDSGYNDHR